MIVTGGNRISTDSADAWMLVTRLEPLIGNRRAAARLMRKILRRIRRAPLGRPIDFDVDSFELELLLELVFASHTEEAHA